MSAISGFGARANDLAEAGRQSLGQNAHGGMHTHARPSSTPVHSDPVGGGPLKMPGGMFWGQPVSRV